jgi:epoxyqueuosine reductase
MISLLKKRAQELGFIAIGVSRSSRPRHIDALHAWLSEHKHAGMLWLERNLDIREDPTRLLTGCRSIISLAYPYPPQKAGTPDGFTVARYSQPGKRDYHDRIKDLCRELVGMIQKMDRNSRTRICVDSAPILERSFACTAGIGFIGKNNMLIIPGHGSYFFLAEILSTTPIEALPVTAMDNRCGSCTRCIDACPTGALEKPFLMDASKCLSYLTIEYGGQLDGSYGSKMGDCFFGCDVCQEACPFNKGGAPINISLPTTEEFLGMDDGGFKEAFGKTAFARAGLEKLKSNILAMRG